MHFIQNLLAQGQADEPRSHQRKEYRKRCDDQMTDCDAYILNLEKDEILKIIINIIPQSLGVHDRPFRQVGLDCIAA
jgi:hypothetical protein